MKNIKNLTAVFSLFSTGITIVTNGTNRKQFFGCTVNSFSSLSLVPPKFLFCLGNENLNLKSFKLNSPLNVNFLAKSQLNLSNKFAGSLEKRWVNTKYKIANNIFLNFHLSYKILFLLYMNLNNETLLILH